MTKYILVYSDTREPVPDVKPYDSRAEAADAASERTQNSIPGLSFGIERIELDLPDPIMFQDDYPFDDDEQNSAEDNDDSNTTMSNYDFITTDDDESDEQTTDDSWTWDFGDHSMASKDERSALSEAIGDTMDSLDGEIDSDMMAVLEDASNLVQNTRINNFECSHEDCGLGHSHPDWKHDIRASTDTSEIRSMIPGFNITEDFATEMEFVPFCHCGANEAAMLVQFFPYFSDPMFKDEERFEGVSEVDPELLDILYRRYTETEIGFNRLCSRIALQAGESEQDAFPLGVREDVKAFFERREQIEQQAQGAPIGEETRHLIEENREDVEEVCKE